MKKQRLWLLLFTLLAGCMGGPLAGGGTAAAKDVKPEIHLRARPYALNLAPWEIENFLMPATANYDYSGKVLDPASLSAQISSILHDEGINPFPSVHVNLRKPPLLLVISPRDRIEYYDRILLYPDLNAEQIAAVEQRIERLNLSPLVVELGGFGAAYPAVVNPNMQIKHVINAAAEEWSHQYLAFRPLGFLYLMDVLGFRQSPDVVEMNETLAGMMADEIGGRVYSRYYTPQLETDDRVTAFDFDKEMRETRAKVDQLLSGGKIDLAEGYMEYRRQFFNDNGYKIRRLNQAYFAFHGIYGQDPGAVSPVYEALKTLRSNYSGLAGFVKAVSAMTGYSDLQKALARISI